MTHEINAEAYTFLMKIEIGLREFFIKIIKEQGVINWVNNFLNRNQNQSINEFVKLIAEKVAKKEEVSIEENFIFKMKRVQMSNNIRSLYHPFYYLNWPDMAALLSKKTNAELLDKYIGKDQRELLIANLHNLNEIRNHIAHSRFIQNCDLIFVRSVYKQITTIVPTFDILAQNQTLEESLPVIHQNITYFIELLDGDTMIAKPTISKSIVTLTNAIDSFWLNSFQPELVINLKKLKEQIITYDAYRSKPGGLLDILQWKKININLLNNIKVSMNE